MVFCLSRNMSSLLDKLEMAAGIEPAPLACILSDLPTAPVLFKYTMKICILMHLGHRLCHAPRMPLIHSYLCNDSRAMHAENNLKCKNRHRLFECDRRAHKRNRMCRAVTTEFLISVCLSVLSRFHEDAESLLFN